MVSRLAVSGALDGRAFHPRPVARRARHDRAYRAFRACPCRRRRARRGVAAAFPVACGAGHGACLCGVFAKYPVAPSVVFCVFSVRSRHRRGAFRRGRAGPRPVRGGVHGGTVPGGTAIRAPGTVGSGHQPRPRRMEHAPARYPAAGRAPDVAAADQPACFAHQGHLARQRHRRGGSHHAGAGVDRGYVPCV